MTFKLITLGDLRLLDDGKPIGFPVKGLMVIGYLLAAGSDTASRSNLARLLWDSSDHSTSLANLRKTISRVSARQSEIGVEFLRFTPTEISLDRSLVDCDLADIKSIAASDPIDRVKQMLPSFHHTFLQNLEDQTPALTAWIGDMRAGHNDLLFSAIEAALPLVRTAADKDSMREAVLCLLRNNPKGETIYQVLADAYEVGGDVDMFRRIFERRRDAVWGDLSVKPDVHTLEIARRVYEKRHPQSQASTPLPAEAALPAQPSRQSIPRVALLPPVETGRIGSPLAMAELLLQDITIGLSGTRALRIVAPFTSSQISRHSDRMTLIKKHSIAYFLDTRWSVADSTMLFAQLIHIANDEVVWAGRFSLDSADLPAQRRDIAHRVVVSVIGEVRRSEVARGYFEQNPVAYHHYLLGQHYLQNLTLPDIRRARREFKASLAESRYFSPALSGLARSHSREWLLTARGDIEHLKLSEIHANQAIAAGEDLPAGYRELGVTKLFLGDFDESVAALQLAETLSPHYADVIADHADTLVHASKPAEGLDRIDQAIDLNPLSPDHYHWTAAGANYYLGRYEAALASISGMQNSEAAGRLSAASWAMLGNLKKARSFVRKVRESYPQFDVDEWLAIVPIKEQWQKEHYREGLLKAGF